MSEATALFGRITSYSKEDNLHNLEVVSRLPSQMDGYSMFTKEMFNQNQLGGKMDYTIGFARSYKNVEHYWEDWMDEFEGLLKAMKWDNAKVIMETEMFGSHHYFWQHKGEQKDELISDYNLIEKEKWHFGGGHRNFWGMEQKLGWDSGIEELRTLKTLSEILDRSIGPEKVAEVHGEHLKQLTLKVNRDGFKEVLSNFIKLYLKSAEKQMPKYPKSDFDLEGIFSAQSEINIEKIDLLVGQPDTVWIDAFVDWLIDQKKERSQK